MARVASATEPSEGLDLLEIEGSVRNVPLPPGLKPPGEPDLALQTTTLATPQLLAPLVFKNFDGLGQGVPSGNLIHVAPPDTNGSVGRTQYVEWVNTNIAVYDKLSGSLILGPIAGNSLWHGIPNSCGTNNDGDPVVVYDKLADRWVLSQFAVRSPGGSGFGPFFHCVAVSTSGDATGSYNRYVFQFSNFNDYPKMGSWPDGYYVSFNTFDGTTLAFLGGEACAYDRVAMLNGLSANGVCFQMNTSVGGLLPSDLDGFNPPSAGEPNFFVFFGSNALELFKFHFDVANPVNSTFTGPTNIPVTAFSPLCNGGTCVPQNNTTNLLDSLADRLMYRLAYRNFGDHEALVVNHSVVAGVGGGVRWYEIRDPNGTPTIFQQSTYAPDTNFRWMGSIAMDRLGDIALGYSVSGSSTFPSIAFAGRTPSDPVNTLEPEINLFNGTGSEINNLHRWGDYSAMQIDPLDDCTFWYTTEYLKNTGSFNWNTRIFNFKFPSCARTHLGQDFDSDSKSDFSVWDPNTGIWSVVRSSTGEKVAQITRQWGLTGDIPVPGDYDGDGKKDFAIWRPSEGKWYIIRSSDGAIVIQQWGQPGDIPVPGDYDGDGKTDLAVWRPSEGNWYIIRSSDHAIVVQQWGLNGDMPVPGDYDGDGKTDFAVWRPSEGNWYVINSHNRSITEQLWGQNGDIPVPGDYDGDKKTDFAVWRPSEGNWYVIRSSTNTTLIKQWGLAGDKPVPADYDGDGKTDFAIWRPSEGNWYVVRSSTGAISIQLWGTNGDTPVAADYGGTGKADLTVWRPSNGTWFLIRNGDAVTSQQWGVSGDIPVPGDYDGDGKTDFAVWRPSNGTWFVIHSVDGSLANRQWGITGDIPVPGDYDGDGKTDFAVWRPSEGNWYIIHSGDGGLTVQQWGLNGDKPVPGDYDGDGRTDFAVWRPSEGNWYTIHSSDGSVVVQQLGMNGDIPVPGDYDGDGKTDLAVWRPSNGTWIVKRSSDGVVVTQQWGLTGDIPVPADYDGDGKTDFAVWRPSEGNWYIIRSSDHNIAIQQWGNSSQIPVQKPVGQ